MYNQNFKIGFTVFRNDEEDTSYNWTTEWRYLSESEKEAALYTGEFMENSETVVLNDDWDIATALWESIDPDEPPAPHCSIDHHWSIEKGVY